MLYTCFTLALHLTIVILFFIYCLFRLLLLYLLNINNDQKGYYLKSC